MRALSITITLALLTLPAIVSADPAPGVPDMGPEVPAAGLAPTVVTVFDRDVWSYTEGVRTRTVDVPATYDRVVLEVTHEAETDPWDRLLMVGIGDVEVWRATTPRADMTVTKDVTRYGALMPAGGTADVSVYHGTWVGHVRVTVKLLFYADEPTAAAVEQPWDEVRGAFRYRHLCDGSRPAVTVDFPNATPEKAVVEFYLSGHGSEELHVLNSPRTIRQFHLFVDGEEIAEVTAMPYVYAILGFYGDTGVALHPIMWWSAQWALNRAGIHTGVGEIPAYRATITGEHLELLRGARTVEIEVEAYSCTWVTSAGFLLAY